MYSWSKSCHLAHIGQNNTGDPDSAAGSKTEWRWEVQPHNDGFQHEWRFWRSVQMAFPYFQVCVCISTGSEGESKFFGGPWGVRSVSNKWLWNKAGRSDSSWGVLSLEMIFSLPSVHWRSQDGTKNVFLIIKGTNGGKYMWGKWDHTGNPWSVDLILRKCCVLCICGSFIGLMKWA